MSSKEDNYNRMVRGVRWQAVQNKVVGGWMITLEDQKEPFMGFTTEELNANPIAVADFLTEDIARHIVELHNAYRARMIRVFRREGGTSWFEET